MFCLGDSRFHRSPPLTMARRHALRDPARHVFSSNPFVFIELRTLLRNGASITPFPSIVSALFPIQWRGVGSCPDSVYTARSRRGARNSPRFATSPLFATDPRNRQLSPLFATHPKTRSRKSFACHTCDTPRGGVGPLERVYLRCERHLRQCPFATSLLHYLTTSFLHFIVEASC